MSDETGINRTADILQGPHLQERSAVLPSLLRTLRETKKGKRSGSELARELHVWQSHVVKVETGKAKPSDDYITKFCDSLGLSPTWTKLLHILNSHENNAETRKSIIQLLQHLLPTRSLLGPRSTVPLHLLDTYLGLQPMTILTREYLDAQFSHWGSKAEHSQFMKKNPNPRCYTVMNAKSQLTYFDSFLATDYVLYEDVLLVSDYYYLLHFDVETIRAFVRIFDDMRSELEPYFPE